jgi:hypothetical protein
MRRFAAVLLLCLPAPVLGADAKDNVDPEPPAARKGEAFAFDGLKSRVPASWVSVRVTESKLRLAQFRVPGGKDEGAELVVYQGIGGKAEDNVARWKAQFTPPKGKKIVDVAKVTTLEVSGCKVTMLDVSGAYGGTMLDPKVKPQPQAEYRMLGVQFEGANTTYHVRLLGPAATVARERRGFEAWIKGFKK